MQTISEKWQNALPGLIIAVMACWVALYGGDMTSLASLFLLHLAIYMVHQTEEHYWPGGFRQFTNAHVFQSGDDNFPVNIPGVALINVGYVWLPIGLAALFPEKLATLGLAWFGLSFVNSLTHIATSIRFRMYNPGVVTAALGLLPLSVYVMAQQHAAGALSGAEIGYMIVGGVLLHIPVAALFVIPYRQRTEKAA